MPNHADFDAAIATAVRSAVPDAGADLIKTVTAGVVADPVWAALSWMDAATAEGALAQGLAEKATTLAKAVNAATTGVQLSPSPANDAKALAARLGMTEVEFSRLPPAKRRELHEAAEAPKKKQAETDVAGLKAKAEAGTITPTERLTLARLTEEPMSKEKRRDPRFIEAQQSRASLTELRKLKYAHDVEAASGARPPTHRAMHAAHSERIAAIIKKREDAGQV